MAMVVRVIPVQGPADSNLLQEFARPHHRDGNLNPIVQGRRHPCVVPPTGCPRHAKSPGVDFRPAEQVLDGTLGLICRKPLLGHAYQKGAGPAMVSPGDTPLSLTERIKSQNHEAELGHVDAKRLKVRSGFAVFQPMPGIKNYSGRRVFEIGGKIEMSRNENTRKRLINDFLD